MFKKFFASFLVVVSILALTFSPALAEEKPGFQWVDNPPLIYPVVDCSDYGYQGVIYDSWKEEGHILTFFHKDGSVDYIAFHATHSHTFTMAGSERVLNVTNHSTLIMPMPENADGVFEFNGVFQRFIIPGVGPLFMDIGHKRFYGLWQPDGSIIFEMIRNAGPTTYTSNNFTELCAYMAGG
jgi:hypothetical protein